MLLILVEHPKELVTREEIQRKLWPNDTVVDFEHGINTAIKALRRALGDSGDEPKYIETIPRRGYRLMAPVKWVRKTDDELTVIAAWLSACRLRPSAWSVRRFPTTACSQ